MDYTTLGNTGLKVSVAGLGCGGNSRLGMRTGNTEAESIEIVRTAYDLGVNLFDTAEAYKTEPILGKALKGLDRDSFVLTTKANIGKADAPRSGEDILECLENSLKNLQMDYVDVYQMHGVHPNRYDEVMENIVPSLQKAKQDGKIKHIGITETSPNDPTHTMLERAVDEGVWEVMMLGYNMMNQTAREKVFPKVIDNKIGTLLMFVVRNIFSQPDYLRNTAQELASEGKIPAEFAEKDNPLDFLVHEGGAVNVTDAAYRFVRHEPGVNVVLFGTGKKAHLEANIASITSGPLPEDDVKKLYALFNSLVGVGFDLPDKGSTVGVIK
ncbi:MAG: aldo/keto reductase [Rhodospirillaceae bacterium]|nr:aldo/keto reductase [Rhodospirillaceae bacterium]